MLRHIIIETIAFVYYWIGAVLLAVKDMKRRTCRTRAVLINEFAAYMPEADVATDDTPDEPVVEEPICEHDWVRNTDTLNRKRSGIYARCSRCPALR
jgi:hypothetical protein